MSTIEVKVPDIGDFKDIPVIEVLVKAGDTVKAEDPLVTLESDKATMDVPSPAGGVVKELKLKIGDKVSEGSVILTLRAAGEVAAAKPPAPPPSPQAAPPSQTRAPAAAPPSPRPREEADALRAPREAAAIDREAFQKAHASPSVRSFARELGVDLSKVEGTGPKERILREDVQNYVKQVMSGAAAPAAAAAGGAPLGLLDR